MIKKVPLENADWWFTDSNEPITDGQSFRVIFLTENKMTTTLTPDSTTGYALQVVNPKGGVYNAKAYIQRIKVAEDSSDGTIVPSIGLPISDTFDWPKYPNQNQGVPIGVGGH